MNIHISIKTFERKDMLIQTINEIELFKLKNKEYNISLHITDDKSPSYDLPFLKKYNIKQNQFNLGKEKHWIMWNNDLNRIKCLGKFDLIIFIPDDLSEYKFNKIIDFAKKYKNDKYIFNLLNDGREICWNKIYPKQIDNEHHIVGFCDCIFFTNSITLDYIGYLIDKVDPIRFKRNKTL